MAVKGQKAQARHGIWTKHPKRLLQPRPAMKMQRGEVRGEAIVKAAYLLEMIGQ